ncbi:MAG: hypothetical protein ABSB26_08945 [Nitrososphaerales archaeon]
MSGDQNLSGVAESTLTMLLSSKEKGELLLLFHRNPGLMDDIEGIARRIGRSSSAIQSDLDDLVSIGVLGTVRIGSTNVVYLDRAKDKEVQDSIGEHIRSMRK